MLAPGRRPADFFRRSVLDRLRLRDRAADRAVGRERTTRFAHSGRAAAWTVEHLTGADKHAAPEYPIEALDQPDRTWVVVRLPTGLGRAEVQSALTIARESIADADAAEQMPQAAETEAIVREWWAGAANPPFISN